MTREQRTQVVDCASDTELVSELIRRCHYRLDAPGPTAEIDHKILKALYDLGKMIVIRGAIHRKGT